VRFGLRGGTKGFFIETLGPACRAKRSHNEAMRAEEEAGRKKQTPFVRDVTRWEWGDMRYTLTLYRIKGPGIAAKR
jgi:hypothetical protein